MILIILGIFLGLAIVTLVILAVTGVFNSKTQPPNSPNTPSTLYTCYNGVCKESQSGNYKSMDSCHSACHKPPPPQPSPDTCRPLHYDCQKDGDCCDNLECKTGQGSNALQCLKKWDCTNDKCYTNNKNHGGCDSTQGCMVTESGHCMSSDLDLGVYIPSNCETMLQLRCNKFCPEDDNVCLRLGTCVKGKCSGTTKQTSCKNDGDCPICDKNMTQKECNNTGLTVSKFWCSK